MRLYTPVAMVKTTGSQPRSLKINEKSYMLPPHTMIIPSYSALHTHPRHWGSNSLDWEPSRWITSNSTSDTPTTSDTLAAESFLQFGKAENPFIAWSGGDRVCPGRKFSQVECVGVLVGLFREYKIRPARFDGENDELARQRLKTLIKEGTGMKLLLQLLHPERAVITCEKRD